MMFPEELMPSEVSAAHGSKHWSSNFSSSERAETNSLAAYSARAPDALSEAEEVALMEPVLLASTTKSQPLRAFKAEASSFRLASTSSTSKKSSPRAS